VIFIASRSAKVVFGSPTTIGIGSTWPGTSNWSKAVAGPDEETAPASRAGTAEGTTERGAELRTPGAEAAVKGAKEIRGEILEEVFGRGVVCAEASKDKSPTNKIIAPKTYKTGRGFRKRGLRISDIGFRISRADG